MSESSPLVLKRGCGAVKTTFYQKKNMASVFLKFGSNIANSKKCIVLPKKPSAEGWKVGAITSFGNKDVANLPYSLITASPYFFLQIPLKFDM